MDIDGRNISSTPDSKQAGASAKAPADSAAASAAMPPHADAHHLGHPVAALRHHQPEVWTTAKARSEMEGH